MKKELLNVKIPFSMAISALMREPLSIEEQKKMNKEIKTMKTSVNKLEDSTNNMNELLGESMNMIEKHDQQNDEMIQELESVGLDVEYNNKWNNLQIKLDS